MRLTAMIAGLLGILVSLTAQLFAVIDDSYTFGSIGFLGIFSGVLGVIASFQVSKNNKKATILLVISLLCGIVAISYLYALPALLQIICIIYTARKMNQ